MQQRNVSTPPGGAFPQDWSAAAPRTGVDPAHRAIEVVLDLATDVIDSESLIRQDNGWLKVLVSSFGVAFQFGHSIMMVALLCLLVVVSPLLGIFGAGWYICVAITRPLIAAAGRTMADAVGLGDLYRTLAVFIAWKRFTRNSRVRLPEKGPIAEVRWPALSANDLGLSAGSGWRQPLAWFNYGYAIGFTMGLTLIVALMWVFSPFIGMFVAGGSLFTAIYRIYARIVGRLFPTSAGYIEVVQQGTAYMLESMGVESINISGVTEDASPFTGGGGGATTVGAGAAAPVPFLSQAAYTSPQVAMGSGPIFVPIGSTMATAPVMSAPIGGDPTNPGAMHASAPMQYQVAPGVTVVAGGGAGTDMSAIPSYQTYNPGYQGSASQSAAHDGSGGLKTM